MITKKQFLLTNICIVTLVIGVFCVTFANLRTRNNLLKDLKAEDNPYSLNLNANKPHSGNNRFDVSTKSGNTISFYGENLSAGSSGNYFMSLSAANKGYFGNGNTSGSQYENALSNLTYVRVNYSVSSGNPGTLTLLSGVEPNRLYERHYLTNGTGITLNTPANYFRIVADKAYSDE